MEDWFRQYAGFFVLAALIALLFLRVWARRWSRRHVARAAAASQQRLATGEQAPVVERALDSLGVAVHLGVDGERAEQLVSAAKPKRWWKQTGPREWSIRITDDAPQGTLAVLLDDGAGGSVLRLQHSMELWEKPTHHGDWEKFRRSVLKSAEASGVPAEEVQGPRLARVPFENPLSQHRFERVEP